MPVAGCRERQTHTESRRETEEEMKKQEREGEEGTEMVIMRDEG